MYARLLIISGCIFSPVMWKFSAARKDCEVGLLEKKKAQAIVQACDEIVSGKFHNEFIVDPVQGGAGTSLNMNANEVIANRAIEILGGKKGDYTIINPNDDVNCGQSTNDVIPTAGKMTSLRLLQNLKKQLLRLYDALNEKATEFDHIIKMGRTQMQDAVPPILRVRISSIALSILWISRMIATEYALNSCPRRIGTASCIFVRRFNSW